MQNQKKPKPLPFILSFLIVDLILLAVILCFQNYSSFEGFLATLTSAAWVLLLIAAVVTMILAIVLIKNYLALRNTLIAALMVLIFAFWFGISKTAMFGEGIKDNFMLFAGGSFLLLAINIGVQIDLLLAPAIKGFLTMDKKDRHAASDAEEPLQNDETRILEIKDDRQAAGTDKIAAAAIDPQKIQNEKKPRVQEAQRREVAAPHQSAVKQPIHATQQFDLNNLSEEQRKQLLEYQNQRRMARMAARQQMQRASARKQGDRTDSQSHTSAVQQSRATQNSRIAQDDHATQKFDTVERESLFFREEI